MSNEDTGTYKITINPATGGVPHKCPVCDGTGLVSRPPWIAGDVPIWSDTQTAPYACRACSGQGVLWK